jgi:CBS domain containing-hemolysin-like protein
MTGELTLLAIFVVAFVAAVFLAAAETALLRISAVRAASLAESEGRRGTRLARLISDLPNVLSTILLAALLAQITAATVTGILADGWFGSLGVTIASVVLTILLFIYAEAIPKTYAVRHTDRVALALASPVTALELVLRPVVWVLVRVADLQAPGQGITTAPTITEDELRRLAGHAVAEGEIEASDHELIERAFRFGDRRTDDIMVPRTDVVGVAADATVESAVDLAIEVGHRRLVVYDETLDEIRGVVSLRDLIAVPPERRHLPASHLASEPLVVPKSKLIVPLLRQMQASGNHLAIVVDEYGGTAGLVTVEDIAEELLGSIAEDYSEPDLVRVDDDTWAVAGLLPLEDLEAELGVGLPDGDWNTVAGLAFGLLGRLPAVGDEATASGFRFRVTVVRGLRIRRLEVRRVDT